MYLIYDAYLTGVSRWGELNIIVNAIESGISDDSVLMEAAGFLEGALTNK